MTANMHLKYLPKLCKLDEGIMLIFVSEKTAITFGKGCILYLWGNSQSWYMLHLFWDLTPVWYVVCTYGDWILCHHQLGDWSTANLVVTYKHLNWQIPRQINAQLHVYVPGLLLCSCAKLQSNFVYFQPTKRSANIKTRILITSWALLPGSC